ncbi:MAG TPA: membrane protein insertase YidC [Candidatus Binataceae bacterium]|nr:membrane protein insertase YidC [Candidatus Binataceae bacterium]
MDTRLLIAVVLSLAAVFAYQEFVLKRLYPPTEQQSQQSAPQSKISSNAAPASTYAPSALPAKPLAAAPTTGTVSARTIQVENDVFVAQFTTLGGRLLSLKLKKFRETAHADSPPMELVTSAPGGELPLGLVVQTREGKLDDRALNYETDALARTVLHDLQRAKLTLTATVAGLKVFKTVELDGSGYVFNLEAAVSGPPGEVEAVGLTMSEPLTAHQGYYDIPEIQALVNNKTLVDAEKALRKGVEPIKGNITYVGFGDRYFLTVFLPVSPQDGTVVMDYDGTQATAAMLLAPKVTDGTARISTRLYMGPKSLNAMEEVNPQLRRAIDFGWTGILALAFLRALKLFHYIAPNWGVDIILLTVAIRLAFLPMSIKSQRSMMRLQRLQPQVEKLREKFKDDRDRLNREMVDLYKRNHVNPLGGCAPMLLQLPIFIGLYEALLNAVELRHAPFIAWIRDLSAPECLPIPHLPKLAFLPCGGIPVLVLLMGLSTYLQQQMTPTSPDPNQQRMMMLMPLVFTIMFLNFPAGLTLYYFCSNALGIAQQYVLNREFKQLSPANA